MPPRPGQSDHDLVERCRAGDKAAWGQLYERYADRLFDYACRLTGSRAEASDCVQDSFVLAVQRISQLRDADKVRPWLYAIVRSTAHRHYRRVNRWQMGEVPEQAADAGEGGEDAMTQGLTDRELAGLIAEAAEGLSDDDREVLDLHLRHDLTPADIAAALGVSTRHAAVTTERMRERLGRSLAVAVLSRRPDCADFAEMRQAEGALTPLARKRLARHIEQCAVCTEQQRRQVRPEVLLGALPLLLIPHKAFADFEPKLDAALAALRAGQPPPDGGLAWDAAGFPVAARRGRRPRWLPAAAAAVVLVAAVGGGVAWTQRDRSPSAASEPVSTTIVEPDPLTTGPGTTGAMTTGPATTGPRPAISAPATVGATSSTALVTGTVVGPPLTADPQPVIGLDTTTVATTPPTVSTDPPTTRPSAPPPTRTTVHSTPTTAPATTPPTTVPATVPATTTDTVPSTSAASTTAAPSTTVAPTTTGAPTTTAPDTTGPSIATPQSSPSTFSATYFGSPTCGESASTTISVSVTDPSGVASVTWSWTVSNQSGSGSLGHSGSTYSGTIGPFDTNAVNTTLDASPGDPVGVVIVAKDTKGNTSKLTAPTVAHLRKCTVIP